MDATLQPVARCRVGGGNLLCQLGNSFLFSAFGLLEQTIKRPDLLSDYRPIGARVLC